MKHDSDGRFFRDISLDDLSPSSVFPPPGMKRSVTARRLALIGCFRPRQCGIATFTADTYDHLRAARADLAIDI